MWLAMLSSLLSKVKVAWPHIHIDKDVSQCFSVIGNAGVPFLRAAKPNGIWMDSSACAWEVNLLPACLT